MKFLKNVISLILPFIVLVLVPGWIHNTRQVDFGTPLVVGLVVGGIGLTAMALTISSFIKIGKGTLAPWSPTKHLVVAGLYRYVRTPMILGVFMVLIGESLVLGSKNILIWSFIFLAINTIYFVLSEEPALEKRFGEPYRHYKKHVSRWIPRLTPYQSEQTKIK
jgi:protein-S-isoprenylcysteine O-methyltransferase Ste14